nr:LysR family transcriptional regulator [Halocynthiibacter namhaensis]
MAISLPYVALRAFEMVVRKGSFSAAADELGVSQSAVRRSWPEAAYLGFCRNKV